MGNQQPKKISKATKAQIDVGTLKARIHLQLVRDRKNNQIIKGQKQLATKIKQASRNKTQQLLIAQRVVNGLKYAQVCNLLISYASMLRTQAHFISQNMFNPQKIQPYMVMIYSLIYAADHMGLSSLSEFKALMKALNDPMAIQKYVNPQVIIGLSPSPTPQQVNTYMLQFSERNNIGLQQINLIGHKFTRDWKNIPSIPPQKPQINPNNLIPNPYNQNNNNNNPYYVPNNNNPNQQPYGNPYQNNNPNQFNPYNNNNNPYNFNPNNNFNNNGPNNFNNNGPNNFNNQGPNNFNNNGPNNIPFNFDNNPYVNNPNNFGGQQPVQAPKNFQPNNVPIIPTNYVPNFYVPTQIAPSAKVPQPVRASITSINDLAFYPQIDLPPQKKVVVDANFDEICERLKKGL